MIKNETLGLKPHKCGSCGKKFECRKSYVYKRMIKKELVFFCSYSCMREYDNKDKQTA